MYGLVHVGGRLTPAYLSHDAVRKADLAVCAGPNAQVIAKLPIVEVVQALMPLAGISGHLIALQSSLRGLLGQVIETIRMFNVLDGRSELLVKLAIKSAATSESENGYFSAVKKYNRDFKGSAWMSSDIQFAMMTTWLSRYKPDVEVTAENAPRIAEEFASKMK